MKTVATDSERLDFLADPSIKFGYRIQADRQVKAEGREFERVFKNLREAIDYARAKENHIPMCVRCQSPVTEWEEDGMSKRWHCKMCRTSFLQ